MIRALLVTCGLLFAVSAHADVGLGASAKSNDATIYIPITAAKFMFEPYVRYTDRNSETASAATVFPPGTTSSEAYSVGVGIFRLRQPTERVTFYYGGRIAYVNEELKSTALLISTIPLNVTPSSQSNELDGYSIVPSIGFQYHLVERLSIGAEVGWDHTELDGVSVNDPLTGPTTTLNGKVRGNDTRASIIVRFFF